MKEAPDQSGKERLLQTMKQYGMVDSTGGGPDETTQECDLLGEFNKRVTAITGRIRHKAAGSELTRIPGHEIMGHDPFLVLADPQLVKKWDFDSQSASVLNSIALV